MEVLTLNATAATSSSPKWINPSNAVTEDGNLASNNGVRSGASGFYDTVLEIGSFSGGTLPVTANVAGMELLVKCRFYYAGGELLDPDTVQVMRVQSLSPWSLLPLDRDKAISRTFGPVVWNTWGSNLDLWGSNSSSIISAVNGGTINFNITRPSVPTIGGGAPNESWSDLQIDHAQLKIYYTDGSGSGSPLINWLTTPRYVPGFGIADGGPQVNIR